MEKELPAAVLTRVATTTATIVPTRAVAVTKWGLFWVVKKNNWGKKYSNTHQVDKIKDQNNNGSNICQVDSAIIFISITTIPSPIHPLPPKSLVIVSRLADYLYAVCTSQSNHTQEP